MQRLAAASAWTPEAFVAGLGLTAPVAGDRPRVVAIMVASIDGRATVSGRSGGLGHPEDRRLLRGLRAAVDAVLVGTGTLAAERYADLLDDDQRAARAAAGRPPHPLLTTLTRSGDVPWDVPAFAEEGTPCAVYGPEGLRAPAGVRATDVRRGDGPGALLTDLAARDAVRSVACEGGPGLLRALLAEGLVDDLLLTLAPLVVAGDGPTSLAGGAIDPPGELALADVLRADEHLFLHYRRP